MHPRVRLAAAAALIAVTGCSSDNVGVGDVLVTARVDIDPPGAGLRVGATQQLTAIPRTSSGIAIPDRTVVWSSSNPAIATVSESGLVTAIALGKADIRAEIDQVTGTAPVNVSVTSRAATRLGFITQPANGTAGQQLNEIRVAIQDDRGNTVTAATQEVRIELSDNPGRADLNGTLRVDASNGIARFDDLSLNRTGNGYTLRATSGSLSPAISNPFNIAAPVSTEPAALVIVTQPSSSAVVGRELATQPVIQVRDRNGADLNRSGIKVKVSLVGGGGGDLAGTREIETDQDGRARFDNLAIKRAGDFRLRFETGGVLAVESIVIRVGNDDDD